MHQANYAPVRWHQTLDVGYLPNPKLPNSFMATAIDTYDNGDIHPRYKSVVAKRLSDAAMAQVYNTPGAKPLIGPFPKTLKLSSPSRLKVTLDQAVFYKPISGFYVCCKADADECDADEEKSGWTSVAEVKFDGSASFDVYAAECTPSGFAYAWETNPFKKYLGAAVYSKDGFWLPALPWRCVVKDGAGCVIS